MQSLSPYLQSVAPLRSLRGPSDAGFSGFRSAGKSPFGRAAETSRVNSKEKAGIFPQTAQPIASGGSKGRWSRLDHMTQDVVQSRNRVQILVGGQSNFSLSTRILNGPVLEGFNGSFFRRVRRCLAACFLLSDRYLLYVEPVCFPVTKCRARCGAVQLPDWRWADPTGGKAVDHVPRRAHPPGVCCTSTSG